METGIDQKIFAFYMHQNCNAFEIGTSGGSPLKTLLSLILGDFLGLNINGEPQNLFQGTFIISGWCGHENTHNDVFIHIC